MQYVLLSECFFFPLNELCPLKSDVIVDLDCESTTESSLISAGLPIDPVVRVLRDALVLHKHDPLAAFVRAPSEYSEYVVEKMSIMVSNSLELSWIFE